MALQIYGNGSAAIGKLSVRADDEKTAVVMTEVSGPDAHGNRDNYMEDLRLLMTGPEVTATYTTGHNMGEAVSVSKLAEKFLTRFAYYLS